MARPTGPLLWLARGSTSEPRPGATDAEVVALIVELMQLVRANGHRVVAECDFTDELPQQDMDGILARGWP
jgi:hypothetical protein